MYHPDCVQDYVPAEVLAHVVALAAAAAVEGGGGGMITHDVSLDEPVSQLCFYRMVQTAMGQTDASTSSASSSAVFSIRLGRSALGWLGGVLYHMAVALGAKVLAVLLMPPLLLVLVLPMHMLMTAATLSPAILNRLRRLQETCTPRASSAAQRTLRAAAAPSPASAPPSPSSTSACLASEM
jgi:hypothetical protein